MTTDRPLDAPLLDLTDPSLARALPAALQRARTDVLAAAGDLLVIPDAALAVDWAWVGGSETEIRYGAYRAYEALERAEREARVAGSATPGDETQAAGIIAAATAARWDLHGILVAMSDADLDADPGGEEWTIRLVLGHVISSQRGYAWGSAWWVGHPNAAADPQLPAGAPDEFWAALPDEATTEAAGSAEQLRARLDTILDLSAERLAGLPDEQAALGARWSGFPVTVAFRLGRMASHLREHTIQVEKTLAMLGRAPSEPQRLARLVLAAFGRAEATAFGRASSAATSAADRVAQGAAEAREAIHAARQAAGA